MPVFLDVKVEPSVLSFSAVGEKKSFTVKVNGPEITQEPIISGSISWLDGVHVVRSPLVVYNVLPSDIQSYHNPSQRKTKQSTLTGSSMDCRIGTYCIYGEQTKWRCSVNITTPLHARDCSWKESGRNQRASVMKDLALHRQSGKERARLTTSPATNVLAAFDDAIADGVDIISISLGPSSVLQYFEDPIAIGSFHAMSHGILTSNSAGNDETNPRSVTNYSPWSLTVAASSIDRKFVSQLVLGNGKIITGVVINNFELNGTSFPLIWGGDAPNISNHRISLDSEACYFPDDMNSRKIKGKIALCEVIWDGSGVIMAGGVGVIMPAPEFNDVDFSFPFPTTLIKFEEFPGIMEYIRSTKNPIATILAGETWKDVMAPTVVSFSSRVAIEDGQKITAVFTRTVTNVGFLNSTYRASVYMPYPVKVTVEPQVLSFSGVGKKKAFAVKVSGPEITQQPIFSGAIVWKDDDGVHEVRTPLVVYTVLPSAFSSSNSNPSQRTKIPSSEVKGFSMYHRNGILEKHVPTRQRW
ncbi:hypothetical protein Q3G72_021868 [Acer saccharum]|nr:hypothetical protein Q3G72_021868 [Acer saccharum]